LEGRIVNLFGLPLYVVAGFVTCWLLFAGFIYALCGEKPKAQFNNRRLTRRAALKLLATAAVLAFVGALLFISSSDAPKPAEPIGKWLIEQMAR
jgi:hypothetical protein